MPVLPLDDGPCTAVFTSVKRTRFLALVFLASTLNAQDLTNFKRLLIPVWAPPFGVTGVNGAKFATEVNFYSEVPCTYWPVRSGGATAGADGFGTAGPWPRALVEIPTTSDNTVHPRFVFVDAQCYANAKWNLIVGGPANSLEMPVVREDDFRTGTSNFLGIPVVVSGGDCHFDCTPTFPQFRVTVRVINADYTAEQVVVNLWLPWHPTDGRPDEQYTLKLDRRGGNDASYPYYGELSVGEPCLRQGPNGCVPWNNGRIEVAPTSGTLRYWATVSVTANGTQPWFWVSLPK